jgi:hypothetical protein
MSPSGARCAVVLALPCLLSACSLLAGIDNIVYLGTPADGGTDGAAVHTDGAAVHEAALGDGGSGVAKDGSVKPTDASPSADGAGASGDGGADASLARRCSSGADCVDAGHPCCCSTTLYCDVQSICSSEAAGSCL